jgi:hypothetical protein
MLVCGFLSDDHTCTANDRSQGASGKGKLEGVNVSRMNERLRSVSDQFGVGERKESVREPIGSRLSRLTSMYDSSM